MADYSKIKAEYIAGGTSYRKLAKKHDVSPTTLAKVAGREGWVEARHQADIKKETKLIDVVSTKEAEKANKIVDVADKLLDKIFEMLDLDTNAYNTQNIKNLTSALKDLKEIKGIKSSADMREQEARIAKLQKEAQEEDNGPAEIKVVFGTDKGEDTTSWAE